MNRLAKLLAAACFCILSTTTVHAQAVVIDYDHTVNFLKFRTYSWGKIHATDPSVEERIAIAFKRDMAGRYMTETGSGGDLTIAVVEASKDKQEFSDFYAGLDGFYNWQRPWSSGFLDTQATPADVPLDTLIIDMYETATHKLLWRGIITQPAAASQDKNDQRIDKAVTQLISKYPPKYKK